VLLGHKNGDISTHYSARGIEELIDAVERLAGGNARANIGQARVILPLGRLTLNQLVAGPSPAGGAICFDDSDDFSAHVQMRDGTEEIVMLSCIVSSSVKIGFRKRPAKGTERYPGRRSGVANKFRCVNRSCTKQRIGQFIGHG
jgi:hypothetical protein